MLCRCILAGLDGLVFRPTAGHYSSRAYDWSERKNEKAYCSSRKPWKPEAFSYDPTMSPRGLIPKALVIDAEFWPIYPRHEGKAPALKAANAKATTPEKRAHYLSRLRIQLPAYHQRKAESGQRVIPLASTWFNQDRADDELTPQEPSSRGRLARVESDYPEYVSLEARKVVN